MMIKLSSIFFAILLTVFFVKTIPAFACSNQRGDLTGFGCSIEEINMNIEKKNQSSNVESQKIDMGRNLRPVRTEKSQQIQIGVDCALGVCPYQEIFK